MQVEATTVRCIDCAHYRMKAARLDWLNGCRG